MPYVKSKARQKFDSDVTQIVAVVRSARNTGLRSSDVHEYVLCSAMVLCSAKMESYIEDIIGEWISNINATSMTVDKLPSHMRAFLLCNPKIREVYKYFIIEGDEKKFIKKISSTLGRDEHDFAFGQLPLPRIDYQQIYKDKKYPSPKNLVHLFARVGIVDILSELSKVSKCDSGAILKSFNDVRTEIAHNGIPPMINDNDVVRQVLSVQKLMNNLDRVLYKHVCKHTGSSSWPV